jgi:hypothetical protein
MIFDYGKIIREAVRICYYQNECERLVWLEEPTITDEADTIIEQFSLDTELE